MNLSHTTLGIVGTIATSLITPLFMSQSAIAQSSVRDCLSDFVRQGVSPDKAADLCSSGSLAIERCIENKRFRTIQGTPRQREDGRTEYVYPMNAFSANNITGTQCWTDYRNFFNPSNICWASSIRLTTLSEEEAISQCRAAAGMNSQLPTPNPNLNPPILLVPGVGGAILPGTMSGGNPQAIQQCMESLLYRTEVQKPFPGWMCVANDVNCKTVRVRTEISESAAVQACQNAR